MSEQKDEKKLSLEEHFANLEDIIDKMEQSDVPLEQAFALYQQGMEAVKNANAQLETIEKAMLVMNSEGKLEEF